MTQLPGSVKNLKTELLQEKYKINNGNRSRLPYSFVCQLWSLFYRNSYWLFFFYFFFFYFFFYVLDQYYFKKPVVLCVVKKLIWMQTICRHHPCTMMTTNNDTANHYEKRDVRCLCRTTYFSGWCKSCVAMTPIDVHEKLNAVVMHMDVPREHLY